jgi:hypothetical protein
MGKRDHKSSNVCHGAEKSGRGTYGLGLAKPCPAGDLADVGAFQLCARPASSQRLQRESQPQPQPQFAVPPGRHAPVASCAPFDPRHAVSRPRAAVDSSLSSAPGLSPAVAFPS